MSKEEVKELKEEVRRLSPGDLRQVNGGKCFWDTSIENESVPVRHGDPCPRCPDRVQVAYGGGGNPLYLICPMCEYTYTPKDGKFYSYDL